ncbi:MAG: F0F1 ATP synthase subunit gamma [Cellulomonadaceae bacterium]|jgi:F-type H+-transporting ATPase subunit gamma|nr:F0F1 ATP synthase subunit gamma [Cellulomonadaceae bacterium]
MAGGKQRIYKQRVASTTSLQKVFRAQELIAASRIGTARTQMYATEPFSKAIKAAVAAVAMHGHVKHPLTTPRTDTNRVAVLVAAADRGMAGSYSANIIRDANTLVEQLTEEGHDVQLYVAGRRAVTYYQYRGRALAGQWIYGSDSPTLDVANEIADTLLAAFEAPADQGGVAEIHVVWTEFVNMVSQTPRVRRILPLEIVDAVSATESVDPLYDFEPSAEEVLDALLPRYIRSRLYYFLREAAASELASRQRSMRTATDNAEDLIRKYTRLANQARQGDITQELTEIVSGADALASGH